LLLGVGEIVSSGDCLGLRDLSGVVIDENFGEL
jgi:hypothetical protein